MKHNKVVQSVLMGLVFLAFLFGCEPVSVSVNSKGEVAFARAEGVFFINLKTKKLTTIDWNYGNEAVPVIARWSPDDTMLAYSVKANKDSQDTSIFVSNLAGKKRKVYTAGKVITQLEWSSKSTYVSLAQAGADSDMSVADLVIVNAGGMSKTVVENAGDVHSWLDDKTLVYMKIVEKNPENSNIYKAELQTMNVETMEVTVLKKAIVSKTGSLDCQSFTRQIVFTAIKADDKDIAYDENMTDLTYAFILNADNKSFRQLAEQRINFLLYSPEGTKLLVKSKSEESYNPSTNLSVIDLKTNAFSIILENITDEISGNNSTVQAYPAWLNNNTLLYWVQSSTYSSNGQELKLMGIDIKTKKITNYQIDINMEIHKAIEAKGGYR